MDYTKGLKIANDTKLSEADRLVKLAALFEEEIRAEANKKSGTKATKVKAGKDILKNVMEGRHLEGAAMIEGKQYISDGYRIAALVSPIALPEIEDTTTLEKVAFILEDFCKRPDIKVEQMILDVSKLKGELNILAAAKKEKKAKGEEVLKTTLDESMVQIGEFWMRSSYFVDGMELLQTKAPVTVYSTDKPEDGIALENEAGDRYYVTYNKMRSENTFNVVVDPEVDAEEDETGIDDEESHLLD